MSKFITVRASSWGGLFDCAYRWEAEHLLGMRKAAPLRTSLGTAIHAGTAHFDQARLEGKPVKADEAAEVFVDTLHHPDEEVDYSDKSLTLTDAEVIGLTLTTRYCLEVAPHFQYKAVEMRLEPLEIDCGNGITIIMTGSMDRARIAEGHAGAIIPDIKSGARIIQNGQVVLKAKSPQLGAYQLMYQHTTGEEATGGQIIGLQTNAKAEVAVSPIFDARNKMIGTQDSPGFIEMAATIFKTGFFPPNPQSPMCSERFCVRWDRCMYHD